ncbi:MAG: polysaccharide deacetylase family protein [Bacillus sp. (in: Bacteria)]|nr:polysaccharide deacetylase family protein [Bacillus sp. (in: firmicutes)]MCM1425789.1 polysaccharide deacetylase family protein [Eubacterium sp.]
MRKKQMILAALTAAVLTGCGNQAQSSVTAEAKEAVTVKADNESGVKADETAETSGESGAAPSEDIMASEDAATAGTSLDNVTDNGFGNADTMNFETGGRNVPIYCVDTDEKKVALSFDAAWGNDDTAEILSILKEHDIHVTFFMTGGWVESYPEDVKAILADGHDLGNHSENHKNMSELSNEEKTEELMSVHRKVKELTGYDMFLFRPPYGDYDNDVINVAKECQYYAIQWDVDSLDWKNEGLDSIIDTVTNHKNLGNGSIILCHNGAEYTAQALEALITELEDMGYEIVPVSQLIYRENFHMNFEGRQITN